VQRWQTTAPGAPTTHCSGSLTEEFALIPEVVLGRSTVCLYFPSCCFVPKQLNTLISSLSNDWNAAHDELIIRQFDLFLMATNSHTHVHNVVGDDRITSDNHYAIAMTGPQDLRVD
ncbi:hypothetical protein Tco_0925403, partial [Tanacetum coccineum]